MVLSENFSHQNRIHPEILKIKQASFSRVQANISRRHHHNRLKLAGWNKSHVKEIGIKPAKISRSPASFNRLSLTDHLEYKKRKIQKIYYSYLS